MKRASYRVGVAWIAAQDESNRESVDVISADKTTRLLAKLFGVDEKLVAIEVLKQRQTIAIAARESVESGRS